MPERQNANSTEIAQTKQDREHSFLSLLPRGAGFSDYQAGCHHVDTLGAIIIFTETERTYWLN